MRHVSRVDAAPRAAKSRWCGRGGATDSRESWRGIAISAAELMKRFKAPLVVDQVAAAMVGGLREDVGVTAIKVTGESVAPFG